MNMARTGRRYCAAWLGIVALLVQAWLPLVHHPVTLFAPDGEETAAFAALFGQHLALCTAASSTSEQSTPSPGKGPSHHPPACPICRVLHAAGAVAPPMAMFLAPQSVAFHPYRLFPKTFIPTARLERAALPRAPPPRV